jgi:excisionase family DNA binding protein
LTARRRAGDRAGVARCMFDDLDTGRRLSLLEAAPILGVSPHTVRAWTRQRRLPYHKLGRRLVFDRADLERFLAEHRVPAREAASRARPARAQPGREGRNVTS